MSAQSVAVRTTRGETLAATLNPRRNSLNFLRLVFAVAVMVSHAWATGNYPGEPVIAGLALGEWGVIGFFVISGYLIANSRLHASMVEFIGRRVLRIYPGYLVCLLVIAFIFAPLSAWIGPGSVHWENAARFVIDNLLLKTEQGTISSTLVRTPSGSAWWDVSLWTLFYEFACYVAVGLLLSAAPRLHRPLMIAAFLVAGSIASLDGGGYPSDTAGTLQRFLWLGAFFFAGSLMALYAEQIRMNWYRALACLVLVPIAAEFDLAPILAALPAAYLVLLLGARLPMHRFGRQNDISYGIYIYGFPVQQLLNQLHGNRLSVFLAAPIAVAATVPFAAASWFYVEQPALRLSRRLFSTRRQAV